MNTKDKTLQEFNKMIDLHQERNVSWVGSMSDIRDFITKALTNQKNQILELSEMREENIDNEISSQVTDKSIKVMYDGRNDLRKSLKKAIEGI